MPRRRNPYANRRAPGARAIRRATTLSPRQQEHVIRRLKVVADRLIAPGLARKLAAQTAPTLE